jgi:hypothetical protein
MRDFPFVQFQNLLLAFFGHLHWALDPLIWIGHALNDPFVLLRFFDSHALDRIFDEELANKVTNSVRDRFESELVV